MRRSVTRTRAGVLLAVAGLAGPAGTASAEPIGCRQANTITLNSQREPTVASHVNGEFIVAWSSSTSYPAIYGRRFSPNGQPIDETEFRLNARVNKAIRLDADLDYASDGGFVVTWQVHGDVGDDSSWAVWARRFGPDAVPLDAEEFLVNTSTAGWQLDPRVAVLEDDSFVIVWEDVSGGVKARRYDPSGTPLDPVEFEVGTLPSTKRAVVESLPGTGFVVVWETSTAPGDDFVSVQAQRFDLDGTPLDAEEFQINTYTEDWQQNADVVLTAEDEFVVAWASHGSWDSDDSTWSIQRRRYSTDGTPLDPQEVQVNQIILGDQRYPSIAAVDDGFLVAWESFASAGGDDDPASIQAGRYDAGGNPVDPIDEQVNCYTAGDQIRPVVAPLPDGRVVVVWESDEAQNDPDDRSVHLRIVGDAVLFEDGFESGDTTAWSNSVP